MNYQTNYFLQSRKREIKSEILSSRVVSSLILNEKDFILSHTLNRVRNLDKDNKCFEWLYQYVHYLILKFLDTNQYELLKEETRLEVYLYKTGKLLCIYKYINQPIGLQQLSFIVKDSHLPSQKLFLFFDKSVLTAEVKEWLSEHEGVIRYLVYEQSLSHVFGMKHVKNNSVDFKLEIVEKPRYIDEDLIEYPFYYGKRQKNVNCRFL